MPKEKNKSKETGRYAARGVSSTKEEVHAVVDKLDAGLFPGAFCKVTKDYLTGNAKLCNVTHSDGSGTKSIIAYLKYKETGDASVFRGIAQDSIVMNIDDLLCIGAYKRILISNTVNRNPHNIPGSILAELIDGTESFLKELRSHGIDIRSGGGETADVPDLTGTVTVDSCATAVMTRKDVISGKNIKPGLVIIGISSAGKSIYENVENSGIGSNGLTSARHDLLSPYYRKKYPETYARETDSKLVYCGPYKLQSKLPGSTLSVGEALLSPTRTYAPIIAEFLNKHRSKIKGIVHCSGGAQTKCLRFGKNVHFIKDNLMPLPPIFSTIQTASQTSWKEMYRVYNMGHRMEIYCTPTDADALLKVIGKYRIDADIIGRTGKSLQDGKNHLSLTHNNEEISYHL
jgi:phosphoribosylformylglycinamidine cyclo-ligase